MYHFKYHCSSTVTALLTGLALHGCQHRLQVTDQNKNTTKSGAFIPSPERTMEAVTLPRKRPAEALSQDPEEKKAGDTKNDNEQNCPYV